MTTFEVSNLGRFGFMGGRGGSSLRDQSGAMKQASAIGAGVGPMGSMEDGLAPGGSIAGPEGSVVGHGHGHGHGHSHGVMGLCGAVWRGVSGPFMQILGLDRFTKGKALGGMRRAGREGNPFDLGVVKVGGFYLRSSRLRNDLHLIKTPPHLFDTPVSSTLALFLNPQCKAQGADDGAELYRFLDGDGRRLADSI